MQVCSKTITLLDDRYLEKIRELEIILRMLSLGELGLLMHQRGLRPEELGRRVGDREQGLLLGECRVGEQGLLLGERDQQGEGNGVGLGEVELSGFVLQIQHRGCLGMSWRTHQ